MGSKTIADLLDFLLHSVLTKLPRIQELKTRGYLARVNKAFASTVRQQQNIFFSSKNLIGSALDFTPAGMRKLQPVLHNVTT